MVVVEVGWSRLRSSWHSQGWLCGSPLMTHMANFSVTCMWHGVSHARCAIVELTATMRVRNYTSSQIKRGSCWKCSSGWHGFLCALSPVHTSNNVEATLSKQQATKLPVASTMLPFWETMSNVASTLLPKTATTSKQHSTL